MYSERDFVPNWELNLNTAQNSFGFINVSRYLLATYVFWNIIGIP